MRTNANRQKTRKHAGPQGENGEGAGRKDRRSRGAKARRCTLRDHRRDGQTVRG